MNSSTIVGAFVVGGLTLVAVRRMVVAAYLGPLLADAWRCGDDNQVRRTELHMSREVITATAIMALNRVLADRFGWPKGAYYYWEWRTIGAIVLMTVLAGSVLLAFYYLVGRRDPRTQRRAAFEAAVVDGDIAEATRLADAGADVNAPGVLGMTPLMHAARGPREIVTFLLDRGADVAARSRDGSTALSAAAAEGLTENVELLLRSGADPDIIDAARVTPLIAAAARGAEGVVSVLLAAGADFNAVNADGMTALDVAIMAERHEIARLIRERQSVATT